MIGSATGGLSKLLIAAVLPPERERMANPR